MTEDGDIRDTGQDEEEEDHDDGDRLGDRRREYRSRCLIPVYTGK